MNHRHSFYEIMSLTCLDPNAPIDFTNREAFSVRYHPRCCAKARSTGEPCKAKAMENGKCRNHGGLSTGAKTEVGKTAIKLALKERMATFQAAKAKEGYQRWLESGGREFLAKSTARRHWKKNPLWIHFGIMPSHLLE